MVKAKMYRQIQEMKRAGKSKRAISRELKIDQKTVKKYYEMSEDAYQHQITNATERSKLFDEYRQDILRIYKKNGNCELNMCSVYDYLEEKHSALPGTEKSLRNYINYLRQKGLLKLQQNQRYYQQVEQLPYGKQAQLDFGEYRQQNGTKLYIFAALLSASRFKYVSFQEKPFKTMDVLNHLCECFRYFGGVTEELVIDQDRALVVSENHGDIIYTKDFQYFLEEQNLKMYVCRKADPESKGKVENLVKYVKQNFLQTRSFETEEEANESALKWLERRANGKISQATELIPAVVINEERPHLQKLRNSIFKKSSYIGREERIANEKAVISVSACRYQLPYEYKNRTVEIYETEFKIIVFNQKTQQEIIEYEKSAIPGKLITSTDFRRQNKISMDKLLIEVKSMFPWPLWQQFVAVNLKTFTRYKRDQLMLARKYFKGKKTDELILKKAIEFCFSTEAYSFAVLNETYTYYSKMHHSSKKLFDNSIIEELEQVNRPGIQVQQPSLELYCAHIKKPTDGVSA